MKKYLLALLISLSTLTVPSSAYAANLFLNGSTSIVPTECKACPCGVGGALQFIQNIMNVMISLAIIFMVFFIVWAGFLFVMSATNPESRSKARSMLINAFVGMVIVLAGWLIVDFVMKTLYGGGTFGPWNKILQINDPDGSCIIAKTPQPIQGLPGVVGAVVNGGSTGGSSGGGGITVGGGSIAGFSYQTSGVSAQQPAVSSALASLLTCMSPKVPKGVGQISALTDSYSTTNATRIAHCAAVGRQGDKSCSHTANSCHYGGRSCVGQTYAVDFGDEQNQTALINAAKACGATRAAFENGNHVHVSAGGSCGCDGG